MLDFDTPLLIAAVLGCVWALWAPLPAREKRLLWLTVPLVAVAVLQLWVRLGAHGWLGYGPFDLRPVAAGALLGALIGVLPVALLRSKSFVSRLSVAPLAASELLAALLVGTFISALGVRSLVLLHAPLFAWEETSGIEGAAVGTPFLVVSALGLGVGVLALARLRPERAARVYRWILALGWMAAIAVMLHAQHRIQLRPPSWWLEGMTSVYSQVIFGGFTAAASVVMLVRSVRHVDVATWALAVLALGQGMRWLHHGVLLLRTCDVVYPRPKNGLIFVGFIEVAQIVLVGQALVLLLGLGLATDLYLRRRRPAR